MANKDRNDLEYSKFTQVSDLDDTTTANVTYVGLEHPDGRWLIKKIDESSGLSITYATILNNQSFIPYSSAWSARTSLTYNAPSTAL